MYLSNSSILFSNTFMAVTGRGLGVSLKTFLKRSVVDKNG